MSDDNLVTVNKLDELFIKKPLFTSLLPDTITLHDTVISYHNGQSWKLYPLTDAIKYPVIHDVYYEKVQNKQDINSISDISVTFCPFSFSGVIYFGKYVPTGKVYNSNILLKNINNGTIIQQLTGDIFGTKQSGFMRRGEVQIMSLRSALSRYPDCLFYHGKGRTTTHKLIDDNYLTDKKIMFPISTKIDTEFNLKNLVYGIIFKNDSIVLVSTKNSVDYEISGYANTIHAVSEDIKANSGIIIPCFWFAWRIRFPKSKIVKI